MPTNDSNLTNTYIANTYQKLLQVDSQHSAVGSIPFDNTDVQNAIDNDSATILNGLGQKQTAIIIDHDVQYNNGGVFLKNTSFIPGGMWGIQVAQAGSESGLNFWGVGSIAQNYKLFLKNSGTLWVGYNDSSVPGADESGYNLYVREGITSGSRVRTRDYNNFIESDINLSLSTNRSVGILRNEKIICSGYCQFVANYGATLTNTIVKWENTSINPIPSSYTISGVYSGSPGGDTGWINYEYAEIYWNRVGGKVNGTIFIKHAYAGDTGRSFPDKGLGRPMLFHYPVYLLDASTLLPYYPTGQYDIIGSGVTSKKELVEVKTSTNTPSGIGTFMVSIGAGDGDDFDRDVRANFMYQLY